MNSLIPPYGVYLASFEGISISAAQDLFEVKAPTDAVVMIESLTWCHCSVLTATDEILDLTVKQYSGSPTSGSGGASVTAYAQTSGQSASGSTVERNNTTRLTGGTLKYTRPFQARTKSEHMFWDPADRGPIVLSPGETFVWGLETAPAAAITVSATIKFCEAGG